MSDFVSEFWNLYVVVISLVSIIGCGIFLKFQSVHKGSTDTTGHVWDETLAEYNNPLPAWWKWMFYITIVFALAYLALIPLEQAMAGHSPVPSATVQSLRCLAGGFIVTSLLWASALAAIRPPATAQAPLTASTSSWPRP